MNSSKSLVRKSQAFSGRASRIALGGVISLLLALTFSASAVAHHDDEFMPNGGRLPGQADFERVGKTTYRFLPGEREYEIHREGQPAGFAHVDFAAADGVHAGPNTPLPTSEDAPICRMSGHRIVVVYTHRPSDGSPTPVGQIQSIIRRMNWKIVDQSAQASGGARTLQMVVDCNAGGAINVYNVATSDNNLSTIQATVGAQLFGQPVGDASIKYLAFDPESNASATGIGTHYVDAKKKFSNINATISGQAIAYYNLWETHVPMHELFHTVGASQGAATEPPPFASKGAHCYDGLDILCYEDGSGPFGAWNETRCPASLGYDQANKTPVDCGKDTYFNPTPEAGSWLATHWNSGGIEDPFLISESDPALEVETGGLVSVTSSEATVAGSVAANSGLETKYRFEYGTTTSYGSSAPASFTAVTSTMSGAPVKQTLTGLTAGTEYHYRLVATNSKGTINGADRTFVASLWRIRPTPSFEKTTDLYDVSCSGHNCTAVGAELKQPKLTMALRYEGGEWSNQATPNPAEASESTLNGVSCPASNSCVAVGLFAKSGETYPKPLAEYWNGSSWTINTVPSPVSGPPAELLSVSCSSAAFCIGVGRYKETTVANYRPLAVAWNGTAWSLLAPPNPEASKASELQSVSCVSSASCVAVGTTSSEKTLIERWNGSSWSIETSPVSAGTNTVLRDVSCASASACMAVGEAKTSYLALSWNGTKWTEGKPAESGAVGSFAGVSCPGASACYAVGTKGGQFWNGSAWALEPMAAIGELLPSLQDISCWDSTSCASAAFFFDAGQNKRRPVIEQRSPYLPPTVNTAAADKISEAGATLNGTINTGGAAGGYYFEYGKTTSYGSRVPISTKEFGASGEDINASQVVEGLTSKTTYHYRLVALSDGGVSNGADRIFTTRDVMPIKVLNVGSAGTGNGQFSFPRGIAVDASGNVWVADGNNNRIEKFNESGEFISKFGSGGTGGGQFNTPVDIALVSNGDLWITDALNCRVQEFNPSGTLLSQFGSCGEGESQFIEPSGIAIGPSGHLWITDHRADCVKEFTAGGIFVRSVHGSGSGQGPGEFFAPQGIAVSANGHVWVADGRNNRIQELSATGEFLSQFGSYGTGDGQFAEPNELAVTSSGLIWVSDRETGRVQEFNAAGEFLGKIGNFSEPAGIDAGSEGSLYVSNSVSNRVEKWRVPKAPTATTQAAQEVGLTSARLKGTINGSGFPTTYRFEYGKTAAYGTSVPIPDKAIGASAKAVEVSQLLTSLTAATTYHFRVVAQNSVGGPVYGADKTFTTPGITYKSVFGSVGSGNGQFNHPADVAWYKTGNLWVVDQNNNRIEKFSESGEYLSQFGSAGTGNGQFNAPASLAVDLNGNFWVADTGNNRIQYLTSKGEFILKFGSSGSAPGQFNRPEGVAADDLGNVWVADTQNGRLQKFKSNGELIKVVGSKGSEPGQLGEPTGIDTGPGGTVWVTDWQNNRVAEFSPSGEFMKQFGTAGNGDGQFSRPDTIEVDTEGRVWVGDQLNSRVQLFNESGEYLGQFGTAGSGTGQFSFGWPMGIATDSKGSIWVTDSNNNRLQKWGY